MEREGEGKIDQRQTGTDCRAMAVDSGCVPRTSDSNQRLGKETNPLIAVPAMSSGGQQQTASSIEHNSDTISPASTRHELSHNIQSVNDPNTYCEDPGVVCKSTCEEVLTSHRTICALSPQLSRNVSRFDELRQCGSAVICAHELGSGDGAVLRPTPATTLCVALNRLMQDSGYMLKEGDFHPHASSVKWKYGTSIHDEVKVHLACVKMGPTLSVHAMAALPLARHMVSLTLSLPISSHVGGGEGGEGFSLLRPDQLARIFKDNISHKLLTDIRQALGLPEVGTFSSLFPELKLCVCRLLDLRSLIAVSSMSKELNILCQDPYLWRHMLFRDFGSVVLKDGHSWKQLYIERYKAKRQRSREQFSFVDHWPFMSLIPPPHPLHSDPPFPPTVAGGDYDLLPRVSDPLRHMLADPSTQMLIDHRHHWTSPILPHTRLRRRGDMSGDLFAARQLSTFRIM